jgi:flagellar biosynthesis protein FlhB
MAGENRSEKATPRRREKAREQGRVPRSPELSGAFAVCAAMTLLAHQFMPGVVAWRAGWHWALSQGVAADVRPVWGAVLSANVARYWLLPALAASFGVALLSSVAQGGLVFAPALLKPSWERISPGAKLKQLFSIAALASLGKSLLPAIAITWLFMGVVKRDWSLICSATALDPRAFSSALGGRLLELVWKSALVLLVWSVVDFFVKRRKFEQDLRMTQQELREEIKESEGNPQIKARIRKMQRQVRRKRMLQDVAKAAVVITNPTSYAIALEYHEGLVAPLVVAKGRNLLAEQIKNTARWNGVPTVENVPLAHALYRTAEVGQAIPAKLYTAVAEILAFLFRAQARVRAGGMR